MKAYKGPKRIAKKLNCEYFTDKEYRDTLDYLLRAKPGDLIATCDGWNSRIAKLDIYRLDSKTRAREWYERKGPPGAMRTKIVTEVRVTDDKGRWHFFPGGGCVALPESVEEIESYWRSWDDPEALEMATKWWDDGHTLRIVEALRRGERICTDDGERLEKFWNAG